MNKKALQILMLLSRSRAVSMASTIVEAELNINYKEVSKIGSYLEEIGAVTKFNKRGGTADYTITPIGFQWLNREIRAKKKRWIYIIVSIALISIYIYSYTI
jgi:predicted transcriptional regulator